MKNKDLNIGITWDLEALFRGDTVSTGFASFLVHCLCVVRVWYTTQGLLSTTQGSLCCLQYNRILLGHSTLWQHLGGPKRMESVRLQQSSWESYIICVPVSRYFCHESYSDIGNEEQVWKQMSWSLGFQGCMVRPRYVQRKADGKATSWHKFWLHSNWWKHMNTNVVMINLINLFMYYAISKSICSPKSF